MTAVASRSSTASRIAAAAPAGLRLAYLVNTYPTGSQTFIRREILGLESRGHHILRLAIRKPEPPPVDDGDKAELARTHYCLSSGGPRIGASLLWTAVTRPIRFLRALSMTFRLARRSGRGIGRHLAYLAEACALLGILRREQVQHLHAHFGTNSAAVALLLRLLGGPPYSFTVHGPEEFDAPHHLALDEKVAHAAFVVAITDFCAAQLKRWLPLPQWPKVSIVGCTVSDAFFGAAAPLDPASRIFICVGRLSAQKGHFVLVDAFARLIRDGIDAKLVLAGDGEQRREIEARIAGTGLQGRIEITGWLSEADIRKRILTSRALVLSSIAEGLPMVLMEALALGRPVIATSIAGIPELVKPGLTGWLVTPGNASELARAMREALDAAPAQLESLATVGRALVRHDHSTDTETAKLETLLLSSLGPS
jgi:glycosyltransferase involved in cell wall biosynthesis